MLRAGRHPQKAGHPVEGCGTACGAAARAGRDLGECEPVCTPWRRAAVQHVYGVETGKISRQKYVELCCTNPAKINGIYPQKGVIASGSDADIVIFDPKYEGVFTNADSLQGVDYYTYEGMKQKGRPDKVFLRGELVADCGKYVGKSGTGQFVSAKPFGL